MPPIVLAALLQIADAAPVTRVSTSDDCEIMVLAGKEVLGWGAERPKYSFSADTTTSDGKPAFVFNCVLQDFGIIPPAMLGGRSRPLTMLDVLPSPDGGAGRLATRIRPRPPMSIPGWDSTIAPPVYHIAGLHASTSVNLVEHGTPGRGGTLHSWHCNFYRYFGRWYLEACKPQPDMKLEHEKVYVR